MKDVTKIEIRSSSGYCPVEYVYNDKLTITPDGISYEYVPYVETENNKAQKWTHKDDSVLYSQQFEYVKDELIYDLKHVEKWEVLDCGEIDFTVSYSDGSKQEKSYPAITGDFNELFESIRYLIPVSERIPEILLTDDEYDEMNGEGDTNTEHYIQAIINNCRCVPSTLKELNEFRQYPFSNMDMIFHLSVVSWTVPKWVKKDDIVFFMVQKEMRTKLSSLRKELNAKKAEFDDEEFSLLSDFISEFSEQIKKYHGKIIAIGRVNGVPERDPEDTESRWKSQIYVDICQLKVLNNPIDISEFNDFIRVSRQSAITGVFGDDFERLKEIVMSKNEVPDYFRSSHSSLLQYNKIDKDTWLSISNDYRRYFILEEQYREYYVDFLLKSIKDNRTRLYEECRCKKTGHSDSFVDNVISFNKKYLMVEDKLNINTETDIKGQVRQYCNVDCCYLMPKSKDPIAGCDFYETNVVIVDTENIYLYDANTNHIEKIYDLNTLRSKKDIQSLVGILKSKLQ